MELAKKNNAYLQKLYLNAGKTVMDKLFSICRPHTDNDEINSLVQNISMHKTAIRLAFKDDYCAFFHSLCCKLSNEV